MRRSNHLLHESARGIVWVVALFYAYGALVHILNMLGMNGFAWSSAPLKWKVLDIVYLVVDVIVVSGMILRWTIGFVAFYIAAVSQIVLYTVFRDWIIDVPARYSVPPEKLSYLTSLVAFHVVTLCLVTFAIYVAHNKAFERTRKKDSGVSGV